MKIVTKSGMNVTRSLTEKVSDVSPIEKITLSASEIRDLNTIGLVEAANIIHCWAEQTKPTKAPEKQAVQPYECPLEQFITPHIPVNYEYVGYRVPKIDDYVLRLVKGQWVASEFIPPPPTINLDSEIIIKMTCWRARRGRNYEHVTPTGAIVSKLEAFSPIDDQLWEAGNYFKPGTAQPVADKIVELYERSKQGVNNADQTKK